MLLAVTITPLVVAFASAIAAGIAAISSPLSVWAVTRLQQKSARASRIYPDRRDAYKSILTDAYRGKVYLDTCVDDLQNNQNKTALEILRALDDGTDEPFDDEATRLALIGTLGTQPVVEKHTEFIAAWNVVVLHVQELRAFSGIDADLRTEATRKLSEGLKGTREPIEALRVAIADDLSD